MFKISPRQNRAPAEEPDAIGIVVQDGRRVTRQPRAVAFVWGQRIRSAPSLPYGRWKKDVRPAA